LVKDIPTYIAELDELEDVYFGRKEVKDPRNWQGCEDCTNTYGTCHHQDPRCSRSSQPAGVLGQSSPKGKEKAFVAQRLAGYGYQVDANDQRFLDRLEKAINWAKDIDTITTGIVQVDDREREAILELASIINASDDENYLQNSVFTIAKKHNLEPGPSSRRSTGC